jgi:hypothetical protein
LQSDGYSAYTAYLKRHDGVQLISCLAHIRRKFFDACKNDPERADLALRACQYLYRIEDKCRERGVGAEVRQRMRRPSRVIIFRYCQKVTGSRLHCR